MDQESRQPPLGLPERLRLPALLFLAVAVPLAGFMAVKVPGTSFQKKEATLAIFDYFIWPALVLVLVCRWRRRGWGGALRSLAGAPAAGWFLALLALWSGLLWPRLGGLDPLGLTAVGKKLLPVLEYGAIGFLVFAELGREARARQWALAVLAGVSGIAVIYGAVQYFGGGHDFQVGSFFGNRNALGAFLAVAVPFFAVAALTCRGWGWRAAYGVLAAAGTLLATTGGALLGIACGVLAGAALAGRRQAGTAFGALVLLLMFGQCLPRRNIGAALESLRVERTCPKTGEKLLAMRYLRAGAEINVLRAPFRKNGPEVNLLFGLGPGGYDRSKRFRPSLGARESGQTDNVDNYDVLADEPGTFNLFGVAAAEMGILGLVGFLWLFFSYARSTLTSWRAAPEGGLERSLALGAFAALVGAAVVSPFGSAWVRGAGPLLVMLVGLAAGAMTPARAPADIPEDDFATRVIPAPSGNETL